MEMVLGLGSETVQAQGGAIHGQQAPTAPGGVGLGVVKSFQTAGIEFSEGRFVKFATGLTEGGVSDRQTLGLNHFAEAVESALIRLP